MAKQLTVDQYAAKWQAGMNNAGQAYKDGINAVTENPCAKAASSHSRQKYAAATAQAAMDGGAMEQGLNAVGIDVWKRQAAGVGATNLATGATKGLPKVKAKGAQVIAAYNAGSSAAAQAVGVSAKMMANINAMRAAFGKGPLS